MATDGVQTYAWLTILQAQVRRPNPSDILLLDAVSGKSLQFVFDNYGSDILIFFYGIYTTDILLH